jgi:hypothetical protein
MIKSALAYVEKRTNVMVYARDKDFVVIDNLIRIYDYPINSTVEPTENVSIEVKTLYSIYCSTDSSVLTLNVGYTDPANVPNEMIDAGLEIISAMFYNQEDEKKTFTETLPSYTKEFLSVNSRFIL